jgi:predicted glycosyltransferase
MKIWIDFINTPQVNFFEPLIEELKSEGHEFVLTCRDSSNTVNLLKQKKWDFSIIGDRVHKTFLTKLLAFPRRVLRLKRFLKNQNIDVSIGQSSFYLPITSYFLGIKSIYTNDNEHAMGNIPSFLFADVILLPESLSIKKAIKQGAKEKKIIIYPGIKEGVYLWVKGSKIQERRKLKFPKTIYVRPEPQTAEYYSGKINFLDHLLEKLQEDYRVVILVRDKNQFQHYSTSKFSKIEVPEKTLDFDAVAEDCLLFIGAGGSMTREMAIIGIPTISVYQGELLDVDNFLINNKFMIHDPDLNLEIIGSFLKDKNSSPNQKKLLKKGKDAFKLIKSQLVG